MEWQPIETAPQDYTQILAYDARSGITECIRWDEENNTWISSWDHDVFGCVTHWMPLPKPPAD